MMDLCKNIVSGDIIFCNYYLLIPMIYRELMNKSYYTALIVCDFSSTIIESLSLDIKPGFYCLGFNKDSITSLISVESYFKYPLTSNISIRRTKVSIDAEVLAKYMVKLRGFKIESISNILKMDHHVYFERTGKLCSELNFEILSKFYKVQCDHIPFADDFISILPSDYSPLEVILEKKLSTDTLQNLYKINNHTIDNVLLFNIYPNCIDFSL